MIIETIKIVPPFSADLVLHQGKPEYILEIFLAVLFQRNK